MHPKYFRLDTEYLNLPHMDKYGNIYLEEGNLPNSINTTAIYNILRGTYLTEID